MTAGIDWVSRVSAADNAWYCVCYGNELFVAVSTNGTNNRVMTSPDGITWTTRYTINESWRAVVYGGDRFVAVCPLNGRYLLSLDGITWNYGSMGSSLNWSSICYGNGLFVAASTSVSSTNIITSPDGINWTLRNTPSTVGIRGICYGNGLFVAVGGTTLDTNIMTSPDGITWTSRTGAGHNQWQGVCYGNGLYVAVANLRDSANIMTSPDGITWTLRTSPTVNQAWQSVCYGNGLYVAVGHYYSGNRVMTSPDGITWTNRITPADNTWFFVVYVNKIFVAVSTTGSGNRVMTSGELDNSIRSLGSGDIHIHLQNNEGNLSIFENDLKRDPTLENAIEISLFTDRRADDEDSLPDNSGNKKGYFGDIYHGNIGSKLWLLSRSKMLSDLPGRAEEYVKEALQWMIDDGVVDIINVSAEFTTSEQMLISVEVVEPVNKSINVYKYYYNWKEQSLSIGRES